MEKKYAELQYQLEGLKSAIAGMEEGIALDDPRYIRAKIRYYKEKTERVLKEAEQVIDDYEGLKEFESQEEFESEQEDKY